MVKLKPENRYTVKDEGKVSDSLIADEIKIEQINEDTVLINKIINENKQAEHTEVKKSVLRALIKAGYLESC